MNTKLVLTRNSALRTTIVNETTHRPLYTIQTPRQFSRKTTRIRRVPQTDDLQPLFSDSDDGDYDSDDDASLDPKKGEEKEELPEEEIPSGSDELARIHWHHLSHNRIIYKGRAMDRRHFLPKAGNGFKFTVGDVKLKWTLGPLGVSYPKLKLDDGSDTLIAKFFEKNILKGRNKSYIDVSPFGMEILDDLIVTFVFAEDKRRDREDRFKYSGS